MKPLETYLREMAAIRASGQALKETSYYTPLSNLLNEIGGTLKPKVSCVVQIKNAGAGIPDGGLFTKDQLRNLSEGEPFGGLLPARGAIEVKAPDEDAWVVAGSDQVERYCKRYGQVLVTNYRDFVLVSRSPEGKAARLENYQLAKKENDFWAAAAHPQRAAARHGVSLVEYLKRVMLQAAQLTEPKDVAWFLASYARDALARVEHASLPALMALRTALEEALGLRFEGEKGEHFFRSTLVQTLFYGIFSAWVLWSKEHPPGRNSTPFAWQMAAWSLRVPMIKALFEQITLPTKLGPLNLVEVLDWTAATLNRVDRAAFFEKFHETHAVQYFYEPFLEAFDPTLRKELGVWYTPEEVVRYMVARVDTVLREELALPDGLADPRVYVLDPCCGTGTFLVETLKRIEQTLREQRGDALVGDDLKRAARERIFGFEILPAPFVVSHLQIGLLLQNLGAPLADTGAERIGVYLTNSLTGWEPPSEEVKARLQQLAFSYAELKEEHDAAERVKREAPILVVLGNPPYNAFAGVSPAQEEALVEPYKEGLNKPSREGGWGIKKFNLDDLYIRFLRVAERRIVERSGKGVVCLITSFSYLGDPSFVVLRQRLLHEFDSLSFDSLNGDSRETGKLTPDGKPDPSIFSTQYNREGIRLGTAICLLVRKGAGADAPLVRFRDFWGVTKRADLVESLECKDLNGQYLRPQPKRENRFSFRPFAASRDYMSWPRVTDLCNAEPISGLQEMRKGALMHVDRDVIEQRMQMFFDPEVAWQALHALQTGLTLDGGGFNARECRKRLLTREHFDRAAVIRYALYPFDTRWAYYSATPPLWNRARPALVRQRWPDGGFIVVRMMAERPEEWVPVTCTSAVPDYHLLRPNAVAIPLRINAAAAPSSTRNDPRQHRLLSEAETAPAGWRPNLSSAARTYLLAIGVRNADTDARTAEALWMHALAVAHSPRYLTENSDGVRSDYPRLPLPDNSAVLFVSASLGETIAKLLDSERSVDSITSGLVRSELRPIGAISRATGGQLNSEAGDLTVNAGWGHPGKDGVTMPGKGKIVERDYAPDELRAIHAGAKDLGLGPELALRHLGEKTCDVYLNEIAYWKNVPIRVWEYTIGGYQVIKKWLSYREHDILGRAVTADEARQVTNIARRIAAILLLEPALDANYEAVKRSPYQWPPERERSP